jgi:hypothetical protein|tara:strand:- start:527 stop:1048 length:522 start_codon:yes stop_codon:yes gene_type:complete
MRYFLFMIIAALTTTSPAAAETLNPLALKDGANKFESQAIALAMADLIADTLKFYVEDSHLIYGPNCADKTIECRGNLEFNISFKAATIDLNADKIDEVIVYYEAPNFCGSGGCSSYILGQADGGSGWEILGQFFPGYEPSISSSQYNRYSDIVYNGRDNSYRCRFNGDRYDC